MMDKRCLLALLASVSLAQAATRYVFSFGDSYTQTGFAPSGIKPSTSNVFGNPPYPGDTTAGGANWVGNLIETHSPPDTISWNFAYGGATVNNSLASGSPLILDFIDQVNEFKQFVNPLDAAWTAENSAFMSYFGTNDVSLTNGAMFLNPGLAQAIITSYYNLLDELYVAGGRRFVIFSLDPVDRTPIYQTTGVLQSILFVHDDVATWNNMLLAGKNTFAAQHPDAQVSIIDTQTIFNTILDNPTAYGAPNNVCTNTDGTSCLWWNYFHPGQAIHKALGQAAFESLTQTGFYAS